MSRTFHDMRKWKTKTFWDDFFSVEMDYSKYTPWSRHSSDLEIQFVSENRNIYSHIGQLNTNYNSAPSWFTRLYSNIPKRREERRLIKKILNDPSDADKYIFPLARKPFAYYY